MKHGDIFSIPVGVEHPFLSHTAESLVLAQDGVLLSTPVWRDTMILNENATIKTCFDRVSDGDVLLVHCHAPSHLDVGMATQFLAEEEGASTCTEYLGSCRDEDDCCEPFSCRRWGLCF